MSDKIYDNYDELIGDLKKKLNKLNIVKYINYICMTGEAILVLVRFANGNFISCILPTIFGGLIYIYHLYSNLKPRKNISIFIEAIEKVKTKREFAIEKFTLPGIN